MRLLITLAALLLAGCATTEQALNTLNSRYVGQSADDFFSRYGPPVRTHRVSAGGYTSMWESPGSRVGGTTIQCMLTINANSENRISSINVYGDTVGMWGLSACAEIFK
jgi:hypothetical protein